MTIRTHLIAVLVLLTSFAAQAASAAAASGTPEAAVNVKPAPGTGCAPGAPSNHAILTKGTGANNTRLTQPQAGNGMTLNPGQDCPPAIPGANAGATTPAK